jgi:hypothetical protein
MYLSGRKSLSGRWQQRRDIGMEKYSRIKEEKEGKLAIVKVAYPFCYILGIFWMLF